MKKRYTGLAVLIAAFMALIASQGCGGAEQTEMGMSETAEAVEARSGSAETAAVSEAVSAGSDVKTMKTEAEWRAQLSPLAYHVTREGGTEIAFTGKYWNHKRDGMYRCVGCGAELFDSTSKFDSGTGWPSYTKPVAEKSVRKVIDPRHPSPGSYEVRCARCDSHLGHVFPDGPRPLGTRYCINSVALKFQRRAVETGTSETAEAAETE